jgi:hypothetical protein
MMRYITKLSCVATVANAAVVHVPYDISMSTFPAVESCVATDAAARPAPDCSFTPGDASSCDSSSCTYTAAKGFTADPHFDTPIEATVGDTLHIMWTDPETVPASNTADGTISMMVHDVTELTEDQFATCSFDGLTPMTSHEEPGDAACELTAGTDCSTTDARCTYTPAVSDDTDTAIDETVAEACAPKPRWKAVNVELTEAGTRYFSCSVGSAQNTLSECGTSATCTAADGADQATCDTALAADADGTACTAEATCTYVQGTPACETQPWAHCSVLNQKVTVNVSPAPDPTPSDKTSGAATVAASVATAVVVAALLY